MSRLFRQVTEWIFSLYKQLKFKAYFAIIEMRQFHDTTRIMEWWPVLSVYVTPERDCDGVASDWSRQITWPGYWPLIGQDTSCVTTDHPRLRLRWKFGSGQESEWALSSQLQVARPALSTSPLVSVLWAYLITSWLNKRWHNISTHSSLTSKNIHCPQFLIDFKSMF